MVWPFKKKSNCTQKSFYTFYLTFFILKFSSLKTVVPHVTLSMYRYNRFAHKDSSIYLIVNHLRHFNVYISYMAWFFKMSMVNVDVSLECNYLSIISSARKYKQHWIGCYLYHVIIYRLLVVMCIYLSKWEKYVYR